MGYKELNIDDSEIMSLEREEAESQIKFLGFLIMENKLKEATTKAIEDLNKAKIKTIMATGDNVLTAIAVAKNCQMIKEDSQVFIGDLNRDEYGNEKVIWKYTNYDD